MSVHPTLKLGFLASHGGSSMRAIVQAVRDGRLKAEPRLVVSNNRDCPALEFARANGLQWRHISAVTEGAPDAADRAIADAMSDAGVQLIVLSGYLRKLGPVTLDRFAGRVLNVHPALLPKYGGQGMYGRRVHDAVLASGDTVTGATIHQVTSGYDEGPIVAQAQVPVLAGDSAEDIERRVMAAEPGLFVQTLQRIAEGNLVLA